MTNGETEQQPELKTLSDPKEFMDTFYKSSYYKNAYNEFYKGKSPDPSVTQEEKDIAFKESEEAKFALVDFGTKDTSLEYDSKKYPAGSRQAIAIYSDSVEDFFKLMRSSEKTQDEISALDQLRFVYHGVAAEQLVKDKIVPTTKLGRALCRLILIDKDLDTANSAREPDLARIRTKLGII